MVYILAETTAEHDDAVLDGALNALVSHVVGSYRDELPFGFAFPLRDSPARDPHHPGLLTGAAGLVLALLKAATGCRAPSDRLFLIA